MCTSEVRGWSVWTKQVCPPVHLSVTVKHGDGNLRAALSPSSWVGVGIDHRVAGRSGLGWGSLELEASEAQESKEAPKRTRPQTISLFPPSPGGGSRKFMGLPFVFLGDGSLLGTRVQALFSGPSRCSLARVMGCQGTGRQGPGVCCTALDSPWTRREGQASPGRPWSALAWCCRGPIAMRRCVSSQLQSVAVAARHRYRIFAVVKWMRVWLPAGNKEG